MPPSSHQVLAATARHVPPQLVPPATLASMVDWSRRLPAAFNWLGFECRLAAGDDRVDFAGCCEAWDGGREALLAGLAHEPNLLGAGPRALIEAWRDEPLLNEGCPAVWLEFDFLGGARPIDFAFVCLDPACANTFNAIRDDEPPGLEQLTALVDRGATLLSGQVVDPAALAVFRRCTTALPRPGRALHVAATPHRGHGDLRLHFALLAGDVPRWLETIAWPGDVGAVAAALELLGTEFRQVGVQLSTGSALRPTLGLEAYVARGPEEFASWSRAFAALASRGACDPAKAQALLDWWGHETRVLPGAPWRVSMHRQFYLKLLVGDGPLQAKGYLAIFPRYTLV
jgi:hypothetical protein